jgi:uncharacterized integral membrane protein (TIGR00698 family)
MVSPTGKDFGKWSSLDSLEGIAYIDHTSKPSLLTCLPGGELANAVYPGVLVAATIALASSWLSQHYGAPVMLFGLLFGISFHFLHEDGRCVAGIEFASRTILRVGVGLLGVRITASQIASLGIIPVLTVVAGVVTTILIGALLARRMGQSRVFGVLTGGAVAICGASAALAIASVLPHKADSERDTILTVVAVTALSTLAMIFYPILVGIFGLDHVHAGIFLGGTIHDVAQVIGAGFMISPETGDIATYVKLLRVAMLVPVVSGIGWFVARRSDDKVTRKGPLVPLFLIGFAALVAINSIGYLPKLAIDVATESSRWCLVTAIAALGMKTSFKSLIEVGWRPIALMLVESAWIAALVLLSVVFFI